MFSYPDKNKKPKDYETLGEYIDRVIIGLVPNPYRFAEWSLVTTVIEPSYVRSLKTGWTVSAEDDINEKNKSNILNC